MPKAWLIFIHKASISLNILSLDVRSDSLQCLHFHVSFHFATSPPMLRFAYLLALSGSFFA